MEEVYIVSAKRTAIGGLSGLLSGYSATSLGSIAIREAYEHIGLNANAIDSVYMGNVLSANLGQSPARQASRFAGLADETDCTAINKVCASGMKAVVAGAQQIQLGMDDIVVAGGMESMSNTPHYAMLRKQVKLGDEKMIDGLLKDGLTDVYNGYHMGNAAELCVRKFGISREEQDEYALNSYHKAAHAFDTGKYAQEIIPLTIRQKNGDLTFDKDEDIAKLIPEKVHKLKPTFESDGTITAANSSNLNDGAAALILASREAVRKHQLKPLAKIIAYADAALAPEWYTIAPSEAIKKALKRANLTLDDIDFFEINEAYAAVVLANQRLLGLDAGKVNLYGGAIAMGHPLGASGARILCTLTSILNQENGRYGIAAICNGGGGATAVILENLNG